MNKGKAIQMAPNSNIITQLQVLVRMLIFVFFLVKKTVHRVVISEGFRCLSWVAVAKAIGTIQESRFA